MSKADIWMPLYIGDYLADTTRLTTEQHGAYLLLIMDYWRNGPPPNNPAVLAQITRMSADAWSNAQAMLMQFFSIRDGVLVHDRIDREMIDARENKDKATAKAKAAAAKRWEKEGKHAPSNALSNAQAMPERCPSPSPSPSPSKSKEENPSCPGKQKTVFTDDDKSVADLIFQKLQELNPQFKKPNLEKWANEIRLMVERDKRTRLEITDLFTWANNDSFWKTNILSPSKLREKWDRLTIQRDNPNRQQAPPNTRQANRSAYSESARKANEAMLAEERKQREPTDITADCSRVG